MSDGARKRPPGDTSERGQDQIPHTFNVPDGARSGKGGEQKTRRGMPFAIRVVRLLAKADIATELGPETCWMLTVIVHTQDARHYAGPVSFWNEALGRQCGVASKGRLIRARDRAIRAGWLEYEAGGKGRAGRYRVVIPPDLMHIPDGAADDPTDFCGSKIEPHPYQSATVNGTHSTYTHTETSSCAELSEKVSTPDDPAPGFGLFPCVGKPKEWHLPQTKLIEWSEAFPHLDVAGELRKARQWLVDNAPRQKTHRGMVPFLNRWLSRAQDNGRGMRRGDNDPKPGTITNPIPKVRR